MKTFKYVPFVLDLNFSEAAQKQEQKLPYYTLSLSINNIGGYR